MSAYPLTKLPVDVASGINANGQPVPVDNGDMVTLLTELWRGSEAASLGILAKSTWAELSALTGTNGQWGRVVGPDAGTHTDPVVGGTVDNEGEYIWYASPGPGWKRVSGLARELVHALNIGAGSANAVQATSDGSFSKTAYKALISVNFTATNTGAVTLSIDGETPRNLVTNTGAALTSGYIKPGMAALVMIDSNGDYRLYSYGDASAIQAAAEAAQAASEAARDDAEAARDAAQAAASSVVPNIFATKAAAEAYAPATAPDFLRTAGYTAAGDGGGALYKKVGAEPSHAGKLSITLSDAVTVVWYEIAESVIDTNMLGAAADNVTDDTAKVQDSFNLAAALNRKLVVSAGATKIDGTLSIANTASLKFDGLVIEGAGGSGLNNLGTLLNFTGTTGPLLTIAAEGPATSFIDNIVIRDMTFRSSGVLVGALVRLLRVYRLKFENCYFDGINEGDLVEGDQWVLVHFENCYFRDAVRGVVNRAVAGYSPSFANVVLFDHCTFDDLDISTDFRLAGRTVIFRNCTTEPKESGPCSIHYGALYDTQHLDHWIGDGDGTGLAIYSAGESLVVSGCDISGCAIAVQDETVFGAEIRKNYIGASSVGIHVGGTRNTVVGQNTIFLTGDNSVGIDVVDGDGHSIRSNYVTESGTLTGTTAYRIAVGTTGELHERVVSATDTLLTNSAAIGDWDVLTNVRRNLLGGESKITVSAGDISANSAYELSLTVAEANVGDACVIVPPSGIDGGILVGSPRVTAANTVKATLFNTTGAAKNPSGDWRVRVVEASVA